jgi:hypothetical protein
MGPNCVSIAEYKLPVDSYRCRTVNEVEITPIRALTTASGTRNQRTVSFKNTGLYSTTSCYCCTGSGNGAIVRAEREQSKRVDEHSPVRRALSHAKHANFTYCTPQPLQNHFLGISDSSLECSVSSWTSDP